jgi:hypothetical protein
MRLEEFEDHGTDEWARLVMPVRDLSGAEGYELVVAGRPPLVTQALKHVVLEVEVDPDGTPETLEERLRPDLRARDELIEEMAALSRPPLLPREAPPLPSADESVFVSLRSERQQRTASRKGTSFRISLPGMMLWPGVFFLVFLPITRACFATASPVSPGGAVNYLDVDLFLWEVYPAGTLVAASAKRAGWFAAPFTGAPVEFVNPSELIEYPGPLGGSRVFLPAFFLTAWKNRTVSGFFFPWNLSFSAAT